MLSPMSSSAYIVAARSIPPRVDDLTGRLFGQWSVLSYVGERKRTTYWHCRCSCGHEQDVPAGNLKRGLTSSCIKCAHQAENLVGQIFGRLTVLERAADYVCKDGRRAKWLCRCECGNIEEVLANALKMGLTQSCGCLHKEVTSDNLLGQTFGRLMVIARGEKSNNGNYCWLCRCECGKEKLVRGGHLKDGNVQSCGCLTATRGGKSQSKEFKAFYANARRERTNLHDANWTAEMQYALVAFQPDCVVCGEPANATDHVRPLACGFGLIPGNAVRLCSLCNSKKNKKLPEQLHPEIRDALLEAALAFEKHWYKQAAKANDESFYDLCTV